MIDTYNFSFFCGQISGTQNLQSLYLLPRHLLLSIFQQSAISTQIFIKIGIPKVSKHLLLAEANDCSSLFNGLISSAASNSNDHNLCHIFLLFDKNILSTYAAATPQTVEIKICQTLKEFTFKWDKLSQKKNHGIVYREFIE